MQLSVSTTDNGEGDMRYVPGAPVGVPMSELELDIDFDDLVGRKMTGGPFLQLSEFETATAAEADGIAGTDCPTTGSTIDLG
jgi:hypothetical protein